MRLEDQLSSAIRSQTDLVEPWAPDIASIRRTARGQARRRAALAVTGTVAAVVAVMSAVGLGGGLQNRSVPPVDLPGDSDVITIPTGRDEQVVVTPTVRSTVSPGPRLSESLSSEDEEYDGSGELSIVVQGGTAYSWEASCDGAPHAFLVWVLEPDDQGFRSARCDGRGLSYPYLEDPGRAEGETLRVFVTEENLRDYRRCFNFSPPGCDDVEPPPPSDTTATFGLKVYEEEQGPVAVRMRDVDLPTREEWNGTFYSLSTVAAGATGAPELRFRVAASTRERIAQATLRYTRAHEKCLATREFESCTPTVELLVDGQPVEDQLEGPFDGMAGWGPLEPGTDHRIEFRVVSGNPRHVDLVVKVYEED